MSALQTEKAMCKTLITKAVVIALFAGPLAACSHSPQDTALATNASSDCSSSPTQSSNITRHRQHTALDQNIENSPPMIEVIFCDILTA